MTGFDFTGRTALITRGAGGLGRASAEPLIESGATVVVGDLPSDRLDVLAASFADRPGRFHAVPIDLSIGRTADALPSLALEAAGVGVLDILVNAVGVLRTTPFAELDDAQWSRTLEINLNGVFATMQAAAAVMSDGGSIVTLSSVAGRSGRPNAADYAATKAALLSLTKSAALALGPRIRLSCGGARESS